MVKCMDFVVCWYSLHCWVDLILSANEPQLEVDVIFMCLHGPSPLFYWPEQNAICTVPYNQIICTIDTTSTSFSGQIYKLSRQLNNRTTKANTL